MSHHRPFPNPPPSRHAWDAAARSWEAPPQHEDHREAHSPHGDLDALRSGYRKLRRVSTFTALGYFVLFLFLSAFTPGLMTSEITGGLNVALMLGLCQLPVALAAIALYERIARDRVDPLSATIREKTLQAARETGGPRVRRGSRADVPAYPVGQGQWQWPDETMGGGRS
ncbi:DUF485 domain-containing protein [Streptomyces spiramyceticus]|uniref:DUF485 domain-containing protein n=1 Tax=Streptomyces spiramyceticus TaxID=299717 RepID=UPI00237AF711|nr:DUF485 domain-containing protein [Streptomyces spiramyceticus]